MTIEGLTAVASKGNIYPSVKYEYLYAYNPHNRIHLMQGPLSEGFR